MSQDKFDDLKKRLQEADDLSLTGDELFYESRLNNPGFIKEQLKIMDSGIFHEGQLKGRNISGIPRLFHINDIEDFLPVVVFEIYDLNVNIKRKEYYAIKHFCTEFESSDYDSMITLVRKRFGINKVKKLEHIKKKFMELKSELLSEIKNDTKKAIYNNEQPIFDIFKHYIPDAPDQTIADRISDLLKKFGIEVKSGTILQRMRRAKNNPS